MAVCVGTRLNPYSLHGLSEGDAHVIHNADSVAADVIRSLATGHRLLSTSAGHLGELV
jgi:carbonic anhydrase